MVLFLATLANTDNCGDADPCNNKTHNNVIIWGKLPLIPHRQSAPLLLRLSFFPREVEDRGCGFHCKVTNDFASESDRMMVDVREV